MNKIRIYCKFILILEKKSFISYSINYYLYIPIVNKIQQENKNKYLIKYKI